MISNLKIQIFAERRDGVRYYIKISSDGFDSQLRTSTRECRVDYLNWVKTPNSLFKPRALNQDSEEAQLVESSTSLGVHTPIQILNLLSVLRTLTSAIHTPLNQNLRLAFGDLHEAQTTVYVTTLWYTDPQSSLISLLRTHQLIDQHGTLTAPLDSYYPSLHTSHDLIPREVPYQQDILSIRCLVLLHSEVLASAHDISIHNDLINHAEGTLSLKTPILHTFVFLIYGISLIGGPLLSAIGELVNQHSGLFKATGTLLTVAGTILITVLLKILIPDWNLEQALQGRLVISRYSRLPPFLPRLIRSLIPSHPISSWIHLIRIKAREGFLDVSGSHACWIPESESTGLLSLDKPLPVRSYASAGGCVCISHHHHQSKTLSQELSVLDDRGELGIATGFKGQINHQGRVAHLVWNTSTEHRMVPVTDCGSMGLKDVAKKVTLYTRLNSMSSRNMSLGAQPALDHRSQPTLISFSGDDLDLNPHTKHTPSSQP